MKDRNLPDVCRGCPQLELCLGPQYCEYADGMPTRNDSDEELCPLYGAMLEEVVELIGDEPAVGVRCSKGCDLEEVYL